MKILETKEISFAYKDGDGKRVILNKVSTIFETGKFYTILGVSGSGKTTFLSLLGALDMPQSGTIEYQNEDIRKIGLDKYRRKNVSLIFQNYNLINYMNSIENVMLVMGISNETSRIDKEKAYSYLEQVGINQSKAKRIVTRLSGGEQQRVAIARALSSGAEIILADEPTGNLDNENSKQIVNIFKDLAHKKNKCVIVVTHSKEVAKESDVIMKLDTSIQNFIIES